MKTIIQEKLASLEKENDVRILFACESGSRAWGFPSTDSDYDVRFVYARPYDSYLSLKTPKDTLEVPVSEVLDISGWDIRKALQLFMKSNAPLYGWLQSPIRYQETTSFRQTLVDLMPAYYSPKTACHHYFGMAYNSWTNDCNGEYIKLKKYFYVLRPLLAAMWIIDGRGVAPMEFGQLSALISENNIKERIAELLIAKASAKEDTRWQMEPGLRVWTNRLMESVQQHMPALQGATKTGSGELDRIFRQYISI